MRWILAAAALLAACNPDPGHPDQGVTYRDGTGEDGLESGERGWIKINEILWSGSVHDDGTWDPDDVFIELRNEGHRPVNLGKWHLEVTGAVEHTARFPLMDWEIQVGEQVFFAARPDGCFPDADFVVEDLRLPLGDPFYITLRDADEHLMDSAGDRDREQRAYAGGYDLVDSRSMERVEMMFGARGSEPQAWHFYTTAEVDVPNNDRIAEDCREHTLASPGRANSPDYSGAFSSGSLE